MTIITLATSKGGAGKTTVAQILIGSLAKSGYRVAVIDADLNRTLANWVEHFSGRPITAVAQTDETEIASLAGKLEESHELVVIDTAGVAARATVFAVGSSDLVLIPVQLSSSDVVEAIKTAKLVRSAAEMTRRAIPARVVLTDYQPNTKIAAHIEGEIARYNLEILATRLTRLVAFKEMTFTGEVPSSGTAGKEVAALFAELKELGVLPFYA